MVISQPALICLHAAADDFAVRAGVVGGSARRFLRRAGRPAVAVWATSTPSTPLALTAADGTRRTEVRPERESVPAAGSA